MKTDFNDSMLYDQTESTTEITTQEQFSGNLELEEEQTEEDALIQIQSTRTQVMDVEDFMQLIQNKAESIHNIDDQIQKTRSGIEDYENAYDNEMELMKRLDKERKSDTTREPVSANSLTMHHMEAYKGLQEERQQIEALEDQREKVINQIDDMWNVVTKLFEEGQPVPHSLSRLDEFETGEWETEESGYEEVDDKPEKEEVETEGEE